MKTFVAVIIALLLILGGAYWFVDSELSEIKQTAETALSDTVADAVSEAVSEAADSEIPTDVWSFAVIGDTENYSQVTANALDDMKERPLEFVVHLGDLVSHGEAEEFTKILDAFAELPFPTYYIIGNNDLVYNEELEIKTPDRYQELVDEDLWYSIDHENAHLAFLDNSYLRYGFPDEELDWLRDDLDAADSDFTFLFYHRPLDVPGQNWFGDDETPHSREQNEKFKALIAEYEIDRIFNGHLHMTLRYLLDDIPVVVSGGGGAIPQGLLGGEDAAYFHYVIAHIPRDGSESVLEIIEIE